MTEEEARAWLADRANPEAIEKLERYVALLLAENERQNLISRGSIPHLWARHIVDSAQPVTLAPGVGSWLDVGSGPGLPGIVIAILTESPVTLVEPRTRRVAFLQAAVDELRLKMVKVEPKAIERVQPDKPFGAITARAFASLDQTFASTKAFADSSTIWVLPRGRSGRSELEAATRTWQGMFHVEQSVTDPDAVIVVASQVRPKKR